MGYRSVLYRKQADALGSDIVPQSVADAAVKVIELAKVRADRSYKNWKTRKSQDQTVAIAVHLGIDPRQADQMLRGAISLPKGIGKQRRVIAFCDDKMVAKAKAAGAIEAGGDELVDKISQGWSDFDVAIAHPSMMGKVGKLGRVLGPQGKMPTPKAGTVTPEIETAITEFGAGRLEFRNDDGGNIHLPVGRTSFSPADLAENIDAVLQHLVKIKPAAAKGQYIKNISLAATRTPGVPIAIAS